MTYFKKEKRKKQKGMSLIGINFMKENNAVWSTPIYDVIIKLQNFLVFGSCFLMVANQIIGD